MKHTTEHIALDVALVYNVKHVDNTAQSSSDDAEQEPPSPVAYAHTSSEKNIFAHNDLYAEWDSIETIHAVGKAIASKHNVTLIEANENVFEQLRTATPQIVFNVTEGLHGVSREAQIPAMLDFLKIPYTGSDPLTLATCLDKSRTKEILSYYKIPTSPFFVVENLQGLENISSSFPLFVKPLHEGSSKGIYNSCIVRNKEELLCEVNKILERYNEPVLVEKYLSGREFTVALLGNGSNVRVLPIVEIKFDSLPADVNPIYSFEAKWVWDTAENPLDIFECPAIISDALKNEIENICINAFRVLRCRDWCRIDVRLDENNIPHIIELNPLPGILPNPEDNSCFPKAARAAGLSYNELICTVLENAAKRYGLVA
ncbi:MAG: D-alanine--D-alanine ligase [Bacteroidota bacterium]